MTVLDVSFHDLLTLETPVASVYLRGTGTSEDAGHRFDVRWKNARRGLVERGTPDALVERLDDAIGSIDRAVDAPSLAVFASASTPPISEALDDELRNDLVAFDRLPRLVPLISSRQRTVPHLMVTTDRTGADIIAVESGQHRDAETVEGATHHIHRGRFGGWSHRRIQQRVENRWEANAAQVADKVAEMARKVHARVITVSGDVRACQLLRDQLAGELVEITTVLEVGSDDEVADATVRLVADAVARETRSVIARVAEPNAANGVGPVLSALSAGRVETLLVVDDVEDDRTAWFSKDGPQCSQRRSYEDMVEGRLVDVAVRAALFSGADIRVVPDTVLDDNLAATLRW